MEYDRKGNIIKEKNFLDAVIGLPANLFYGTSIPACILVFKKCRVHDDNILFIDASAEFEKVGNQNALTDDHVAKIVETYAKRETLDKYAYVAPLSEVAENDYNLNIPRYVDSFEEEEPVDIEVVAAELKALEGALQETDTTIARFCQELGVPLPVGFNLPLLKQYKKGMMQKLFSQALRFKDDQGNDFPDWEEKRLGDVLFEHKKTNKDGVVVEVFSVAKHKGVINQIEHLGRSHAAASISHYKVAFPFDVIYTKSPTSEFPFGIIKQNLTGRSGVVSPLYAVLKPANKYIGFILHNYFSSWVNTYNYLNPLVQKGAKNTMSIRNDDFLNGVGIDLPTSVEEQQRIANYLSVIDQKIDLVSIEIEHAKTFKTGFLQQMFI